MCLGIPGKVVETYEEHAVVMGKVDFGGVSKRVCLLMTPEVSIGQYVIVHVGFALKVIDEDEARQVFAFLKSMDELEELGVDCERINESAFIADSSGEASSTNQDES